MKELYVSVFTFFVLMTSAQEVAWQKNLPSKTQDFLTQIAVTIDGQYLVSGSSIQSSKIG